MRLGPARWGSRDTTKSCKPTWKSPHTLCRDTYSRRAARVLALAFACARACRALSPSSARAGCRSAPMTGVGEGRRCHVGRVWRSLRPTGLFCRKCRLVEPAQPLVTASDVPRPPAAHPSLSPFACCVAGCACDHATARQSARHPGAGQVGSRLRLGARFRGTEKPQGHVLATSRRGTIVPLSHPAPCPEVLVYFLAGVLRRGGIRVSSPQQRSCLQ